MKLTPFKQGRLAGIHGDISLYHEFKGRRRADYTAGYCRGLYLLYYRALMNRKEEQCPISTK